MNEPTTPQPECFKNMLQKVYPQHSFCTRDFEYMPEETLIKILEQVETRVQLAIDECKAVGMTLGTVSLRYVNILNIDPESPNYNPDGKIGNIRVKATATSTPQ